MTGQYPNQKAGFDLMCTTVENPGSLKYVKANGICTRNSANLDQFTKSCTKQQGKIFQLIPL